MFTAALSSSLIQIYVQEIIHLLCTVQMLGHGPDKVINIGRNDKLNTEGWTVTGCVRKHKKDAAVINKGVHIYKNIEQVAE